MERQTIEILRLIKDLEDMTHLKELAKRHIMRKSCSEPSEREIELQINAWIATYSSIEEVYRRLCVYFNVSPKEAAGGDRFSNATLNKPCDCGAKHTSFPNFHSPWCSAYRK